MIIDDFTGTNGDDFSKEWWYDAAGNSGIGSTVIDDNEAQMTISSGNSGNHYKTLNRIIKGDFEIEFDFVTVTGQVVSIQQGGVYISPNKDNNTSEWGFVGLINRSGTPYAYFRYDDAGSNDSWDEVNISSKSNPYTNKFRIKRVGNQVSAYYKNEEDGSWSQIGSAHTWIEDDVYVGFMAYRNSTSATPLVYTFDNFAINSCDVIVPWNISQTGEVAAQNVWDENYKAVYHMSQKASESLLDSTSNEINGTFYGLTNSDTVSAGFGKAIDFDGNGDYIDTSAFDRGDTALTVDAFFSARTQDNLQGGWLANQRNTTTNDQWQLYSYPPENDNYIEFVVWYGVGNSAGRLNYTPIENQGYIATTVFTDGISGNEIVMYINSSEVDTDTLLGNIINTSETMRIGRRRWDTSGDYNGQISELRISNVKRSRAWTKATHATLNNTLLTQGSSSSTSSSSSSSTTPPLYYTIDSNNIDENLTDFPVGIILPSDFTSAGSYENLHVTVSGGNELYTEVDTWETSGTIWTKVPWIPANRDTVLTLEYSSNNSYIGSTGTSAAKNVWNENFVAVYHMSQNPTGGILLDSTINENNANSNGMDSSNLIDGNFWKGISFDGSTEYITAPNDGSSFPVAGSDDFTMEILSSPNEWAVTDRTLFGWGLNSTNNANVIKFSYDHHTDKEIVHYFWGNDLPVDSSSLLNTENLVTVTWDGTTRIIFLDGSTLISNTPVGVNVSRTDVGIGWSPPVFSETGDRQVFSGSIFEVRLSDTKRSDAWIKATNATLNNTLLTEGSSSSSSSSSG